MKLYPGITYDVIGFMRRVPSDCLVEKVVGVVLSYELCGSEYSIVLMDCHAVADG